MTPTAATLPSAPAPSRDPDPLAPPEAGGFAGLLREHTKTIHRAAERAGFVADLVLGRASRAGYALFLRNLHPAYRALEPALAACADPLAVPFRDPALSRLAALERDLASLSGPAWRDEHEILPAAAAYAAAIDAVRHDPPRLVAHAYARYLGDLSGGQILKPLLARTLGLRGDELAFYEFPLVTDLAAPKAAMRAALDTVAPQSPAADALLEESVAAFRHNIAVSEAVQVAFAEG